MNPGPCRGLGDWRQEAAALGKQPGAGLGRPPSFISSYYFLNTHLAPKASYKVLHGIPKVRPTGGAFSPTQSRPNHLQVLRIERPWLEMSAIESSLVGRYGCCNEYLLLNDGIKRGQQGKAAG